MLLSSRKAFVIANQSCPDDLNLPGLLARVAEGGIKEVILALNATVDGQTTAHYITDMLSAHPVKITRLAHGVPVGGELDYLDDGTLAAAMRQRTAFWRGAYFAARASS